MGSELNLYQRLLQVQAGVESVKVTGKTPQGKPVISIDDVEEAFGDLLLSAGVFTTYFWNGPGEIWVMPGKDGDYRLWSADITYVFINVDAPEERLEVRSWDIGSNPSAGVSAAIKRLLRGSFHLQSDGEGNDNWAGNSQASAPAEQQARPTHGDIACPSCGGKIFESKYPENWKEGDPPKDWYCNKNKGGCGWKGPKPRPGTGEVRQPTQDEIEEAASLAATEPEAPKPSGRAAKSTTAGPKPRAAAPLPEPEDDDLSAFDLPSLPVKKAEEPPAPDEALTTKALRLAIETKKIQLVDAGEEIPDNRELGILVRKSLDKACESAFGHEFQEATDGECAKLIEKFERFLANRKAAEMTKALDGKVVE